MDIQTSGQEIAAKDQSQESESENIELQINALHYLFKYKRLCNRCLIWYIKT